MDKEEIIKVASLTQEIKDFKIYTSQEMSDFKKYTKEYLKELKDMMFSYNTVLATFKEQTPNKSDMLDITNRVCEVEKYQDKQKTVWAVVTVIFTVIGGFLYWIGDKIIEKWNK